MTIADRQGMSEDPVFEIRPTQSKTDSSSCFGTYRNNLKNREFDKEASPNIAIKCAEALIHFHQNVLSPVDGPRSHFRPSSSTYMLEAIHKYGFMKGFIMGCDRLLRENSDDWCYKTIESEGKLYKYNPVPYTIREK